MPAERISYGDALRKGTDKLNDAIDIANKVEVDSKNATDTANSAKATAEEANAKSDFTQTQLDQVTGASTIDPAVEQMKVDLEGVSHPSPDARLRSELEKRDAQLAQTVNKLKTAYSVFDFGAVGDGVTDDTQAFQQAFDSIPHYSVLLVGNHRIDGELVINGKLITIRGYTQSNGFDTGESSTSKLWFKGTYATALTVNANLGHSLTLEHVTIKGNGTGTGVNVVGGSLVMVNSAIVSFATGAIVKNGYYSKFTNSVVMDCSTNALTFDGCYNIQAFALGVQCYGEGIRLKAQSYLVMHGGSIERFQKDGIFMEAGSSLVLVGTYFEGVSVDNTYLSSAVRMGNSCTVLAEGCHVYLNNSTFFINAYNTTSINLKSSLNKIITVSETDTRQNTVYYLSPQTDSVIYIEADRYGNMLGTTFGVNVTYTNVTNTVHGLGKVYINYPNNVSKKILDNILIHNPPVSAEPIGIENGMMLTCNNQGNGTDDFIGIKSNYGYGAYKVVRNKGQWEKVGVRLPNQADSTATDVATLKADFNALLAKLRANGVMI